MRNHVILVAWLHIILSGLTLLVGLFLFLCCIVLGIFALPVLPFFGAIGAFILVLFALFSVPGLIMGWGLLQFAPWARTLAIVLSILGLVLHPAVGIGLVLGIYSLVVLFNPETVALFEGRQSQI